MNYIRVYDSDDTDKFTKVKLHYQFYFYYFVPYILIDDLRAIDSNAIGLFGLDKQNERVAQSKRGERIYLYEIDNIPVEHGRFILNYPKTWSNTNNVCSDTFRNSCDNIGNIRCSVLNMGHNSNILPENDKEKCLNQLRQRQGKKTKEQFFS